MHETGMLLLPNDSFDKVMQLIPVSYTHLDVYKRQRKYLAALSVLRITHRVIIGG